MYRISGEYSSMLVKQVLKLLYFTMATAKLSLLLAYAVHMKEIVKTF